MYQVRPWTRGRTALHAPTMYRSDRSIPNDDLLGTPLGEYHRERPAITPRKRRIGERVGSEERRDESWKKLQDVLRKRQLGVFHAIREMGTAASFQIATYLNLELHQVSGRLTELYNFSLIEQIGEAPNPKSGRMCTVYKVVENWEELMKLPVPGNIREE